MGSIFYTCNLFPFKILGIVFINIYIAGVLKWCGKKRRKAGVKKRSLELIINLRYKSGLNQGLPMFLHRVFFYNSFPWEETGHFSVGDE